MRASRFPITGLTVVIGLLAMASLACSSAAGPSAPSQPAVQESGGAVVKVGVTWDTAQEPPLHKIGGIPPADLTDEPKYGGIQLHGYSGWSRFDPHFSQDVAAERWPARVYGNGLLEWDLKCNCPAPDLAESWKQVDDLNYDFKIRQGVKFHNLPPVNGRAMTIQDVKWSLDRITGVGERPQGVVSVNYTRFSTVKEFRILDGATLRMVLKQPDSMILRELMYDYTIVLPREAMVDGMFMEQKTLIGTGPFMVELALNDGQSRFRRNPDYWKKDNKGRQLPFLDGIRTLGTGDQAATQTALKTGQADRVHLNYRYGKVFENDPKFRIYNTRNSGVSGTGYWMNVKMKPFDDVRVRRAINLAIDREEMGIITDGPGGSYPVTFLGTWEPFTWSQEKLLSMPGYAEGAAKQKEYSEAKSLLAEAGYPNGFEFTCECESLDASTALVEFMNRIGVTVKVNKPPSGSNRFAAYMKDKQFNYVNSGGGHTPDFALQQFYLCGAARNMAQVCDEQIEAGFKAFRATNDEQKQVEILGKVQDHLWEIMAMAVGNRPVQYYISYTYVRGWRNPHYDASAWAHGNREQYVWLDR